MCSVCQGFRAVLLFSLCLSAESVPCLLMTHFVRLHGNGLLWSFIKAYCSARLTCRAVEWENVVFDNCQSVADLPVGMIQSLTYGKQVSVEAWLRMEDQPHILITTLF